ncbi:MAG TPA: tripartite tricarboxylate transporter substrate binding protein [Burkholderiales bacterium]|nr:tripartite tricarboxylate transporter substrate binding protein [Burkholderiales bacterium]
MKAAWLALVLCCASPAIAAVNSDPAPGFPSKPIRWIVGFTPGASNDVVARTVAQRLTEIWGQQIIIDNRPGAGGMIGGEMVARGAPDGYTVLLATGGPNIGNPLLMKKPPYKVEDFAYVAIAADNPLILVVTPSFPAKTPREFVDYLKANPGKVNWATSGINSTPHVSMAIFTHATGVKLTQVPYKGAAAALIDIVSGQVSGMHSSVASAESQIRSGRVRVIAVAGPKRLPAIPDVPTLAEAGISNAEAPNFYGMAAPAHTPRAIVQKLNAGVNDALAQPEVRRRLGDLGMDIVGGSAEDATKYVMTQAARVRGLIRAGVLTPE